MHGCEWLRNLPNRREKIRCFLRENQLSAWLAWRPDEILLMSGHLPFWGASVLAYFEQSNPILFVPAIEPSDRLPSGLEVREYPWGKLGHPDPFAALIGDIRGQLTKAGVSSSRVGMARCPGRTSLPVEAAEQIPMPPIFLDALSALTAGFSPEVEKAFLRLYLTKSAEEIECIALANRVAAGGLRAFHEAVRPGVSEAEVAATVEAAVLTQTGKKDVSYARSWAAVQAGPNSADACRFNRSSGRLLENGDLVLLELGACVNGYWSDLTRTTIVGTPKPELKRILDVADEAEKAAITAIRPHISAGEVDAVARNIVTKHGFANYFTHHTGHHVGYRYHDPGFGITPGQEEQLTPGMVITIEPGVYVPELGGGARFEDNILVTESGYAVLSERAGL